MSASAVLLVTETADLAADLLVLAARQRHIPLIRFNQDTFPHDSRIVWRPTGPARFEAGGYALSSDDIAGAWFRRPPRHRPSNATEDFTQRESAAFLAGVWQTAPWFWINPPTATTRAEYKLLQLRHASALGLAIPETLVTNSATEARRFAATGPTIAKTLAGGRVTIGGADHAVFTTAITPEDLGPDAAIQACPAIFQTRIDTLFDLRVTVIGDRVFPARIDLAGRTAADVDWRRAPPARLTYQHHALPPDIERACIELVATLHLIYGALDFAVTRLGELIFLELNPAGQWGWIERALGLPITAAILDRLQEGTRCA